ncbi:type VI secretion system Vgr family protein [Moellerella wisconsensis]|uniref:Type VI secretion system tip protein VgrG n=1 Tax=Moellerella wisconsensis TaxID=158849 RepID=A0ACD3Y5M9_9GAMM|nr:type VI secretion system tip protein TssI/VgrG [Moellerella wisconsensis]UNH38034.1 type VI secretion system tip protein VgrG [Moellerella wisconsensis]
MDELEYKARPLLVTIDNQHYVASNMECNERLSGTLSIVIDVVSNSQLTIELLGKVINISFNSIAEKRHFSAMINKISLTHYHEEKMQYFYRISACDILTLLSQGSKRRVFQQLTSQQIIEKVIAENNAKQHVSFSLSSSGIQHEYCCQLDESDGDFIHRLLAAEGWNYFHSLESKSAGLIIIDQPQKLPALATEQLAYSKKNNKLNCISDWCSSHELSHFSVSFHDYIADKNEDYFSTEKSKVSGKTQLKHEFYAQNSQNKSIAKKYALSKMEAEHRNHHQFSGGSSVLSLSSGALFSLVDHPNKASNADYYISTITHFIACSESNQQVQYHNKFDCFPTHCPYHLHYIPKPVCHGLHSAEVTGPDNTEIYRDKLGRIKVHFHWDFLHHDQKNEYSSCWLNVLQPIASKGFGLQFLPRVGDSVLVQFINGDPDNPVVVGSFYNNSCQLPFDSPSCSGFKSLSTPNGKYNEGNELSFEDKKDHELIRLSAQKDLQILSKNNFNINIKGLLNTEIDKTATLYSKEQFNIKSDKILQLTSLDNFNIDSQKSISLAAKKDIQIKADNNALLEANVITLSGQSEIKLKVGASQITISPSEITIESPQIKINGKAKVCVQSAMTEINSQAKTQLSGAIVSINGSAMTEVKAGAMVQIQGAITKIN